MSKLSLLRQTIRPLFENQRILGNPEAFEQVSSYLATRYPLPVGETVSFDNVIQWTQNEQLAQTLGFGDIVNKVFKTPSQVISIVCEKLLGLLDTVITFLGSPSVQSILWTSMKIGAVGLIITVTVVGARFIYVKMYLSPPAPLPTTTNNNNNQLLVNTAFCVICQENEKSHIILPCGHFCLCLQCSNTLRTNGSSCPMCRLIPTAYQKVYY